MRPSLVCLLLLLDFRKILRHFLNEAFQCTY